MSSFRWNRGGDFKARKWDTDLPTDCAVSLASPSAREGGAPGTTGGLSLLPEQGSCDLGLPPADDNDDDVTSNQF